jgi:CelD/BcsL family acetyltransferase involved in cellulose biosynthesis
MRIHEWNEEEYLRAREQHTELLQRSSADPLFQSWDWLSLWWIHFGKPMPECRLRVLAALEGERLIGLLPLVEGYGRRHKLLRLRAASVLGNFFRLGSAFPTEYQDVIAETGRESEVLDACLRHFRRHSDADELTIGWCHRSDRWREALMSARLYNWEYVRRVDPMMAYSASFSSGFDSYVRQLSGNSRRALVNLRKKLHEAGRVVLHVATEPEQPLMLSRLNELHALRWGAPAFDERRLQFHRELIARLACRNGVALSELRIDDRPVSVLYDLCAGQRQYNIQMGFDPDALKSGSLGLLHLGYAMESAATAGVKRYDFLGGKGKNADYKQRFATDSIELATVQLIRPPATALLFRVNDALSRESHA